MENLSNVYNNGEIAVTYNSCLCENAGKCTQNLTKVFRSSILPWNTFERSKSSRIIKQISKCPSGALQYHQVKQVS